jgi:hypothetical protein
LGVLHSPNDCWFFHGFVQVDVATHGSLLTFDAGGGPVDAGRYNDQALLYADLGGGYWLYRSPCPCGVTGVAALLELHYTTTLNDSDALAAAPSPDQSALLANPANRLDVLNVTAAVHTELARFTSLRIGGVFPLTDDDDRFFDAEATVQLIRRY